MKYKISYKNSNLLYNFRQLEAKLEMERIEKARREAVENERARKAREEEERKREKAKKEEEARKLREEQQRIKQEKMVCFWLFLNIDVVYKS